MTVDMSLANFCLFFNYGQFACVGLVFVCLFVYCVIFVSLVHVSLVANASETECF